VHRTIKEGNGAFVHGHTYSQNPCSCAIASAVLDYVADKDLVNRSARLESYLLNKLKDLYKYPMVGNVRCIGLFAGVEFVMNGKTKEPFDPKSKINARIGNRAFQKGLISYPGGGGADGIRGDHIILAPPLIITEEQIDKMVALLDESIGEIAKEES
jgi:adenosylmethionine-8-amino-7-oxononanoate aminotransferase